MASLMKNVRRQTFLTSYLVPQEQMLADLKTHVAREIRQNNTLTHGKLQRCQTQRRRRRRREGSIAILRYLQPLWPSSLTKPDLLRFRCSSGHVFSKTKSVPPPPPHFFFTFLTSLTHHLSVVEFSEKNKC